jgi:hypothetical protein
MTKTTSAPTLDPLPLAGIDFPLAWTATLLHAQRAQWSALAAWQAACAALCRELWDEWACRWAGGVPLDA